MDLASFSIINKILPPAVEYKYGEGKVNTLRAKEIPRTCFIQEPQKSPEVSRFLTE